MSVNRDNYEDVFTYHVPDEDQVSSYDEIRNSARRLVDTILEYVPLCADQQAAIRHVREAVMTANAAIALKGLI